MSRKISTGKSLVLTNLATSQLLRTRPWHSLGINLRLIGPHKSASVQRSNRFGCHLSISGQVTHRAIHVFGKWPINGHLGQFA
jgi:hypothetical protein